MCTTRTNANMDVNTKMNKNGNGHSRPSYLEFSDENTYSALTLPTITLRHCHTDVSKGKAEVNDCGEAALPHLKGEDLL